MEHRWGRRLAAGIEVQVSANHAKASPGRLRDISISGGFIETALRMAPLSTVCMTVPPTHLENARTLHAIVIREEARGVGVEWSDNQSEAIATLMQAARSWQARERPATNVRL